ncbi:hypothetical protein NV379_16295 [Paenibacillus sp. N1-5-1-14]|uniref:hypothetical protein n=1 Tax=Paenibacillus radicibacter TaxID=2972488 RepID=UPI002158F05D|nr:hypothetical protein [Paenibacillus radicibacter]MCR8644215.1 hypothetical protein [Paenibacillus radicibacter]
MKNKLVLLAAIMIVLAGCSTQKTADTAGNTTPTETPKSPTEAPKALAESPKPAAEPPKPQPTEAPKDNKASTGKKLKEEEKLALSYVNEFLNETDPKKKTKFVTDYVHKEVKPIFEIAALNIPTAENMYINSRVIESMAGDDVGQKHFILIQADSKSGNMKEIIVLVVDKKIGLGLTPGKEKEANSKFEELREFFKTPIPK